MPGHYCLFGMELLIHGRKRLRGLACLRKRLVDLRCCLGSSRPRPGEGGNVPLSPTQEQVVPFFGRLPVGDLFGQSPPLLLLVVGPLDLPLVELLGPDAAVQLSLPRLQPESVPGVAEWALATCRVRTGGFVVSLDVLAVLLRLSVLCGNRAPFLLCLGVCFGDQALPPLPSLVRAPSPLVTGGIGYAGCRLGLKSTALWVWRYV